MALGATNISLNTVKTTLSESTYSLFSLGTSSNINKWSKYKPVRAAGSGSGVWPYGNSGTYGLKLLNGLLTSGDSVNWGSDTAGQHYMLPRGGSPGGGTDEPVRLGDFRYYEDDETLTYPCIYNEGTGPTTLYPSSTPYSYNWSTIPINYDDWTYRITTANLSIHNYYLGLKIVTPGSGTYYRTYGSVQLNSTATRAQSISAELQVGGSPIAFTGFANLPWSVGTGVGSYDWYIIASSDAKASWTTVAPTTYHYLPVGTYGGKSMVTTGSFNVADWVFISQDNLEDYSHIFTATGGNDDWTIHCSYYGGPPDWSYSIISGGTGITLDGRTEEGGVHLADNLLVDGNALKITASAIPNYSDVVCVHDASDGYTWTIGSESGSVTPTLIRGDTVVRITSNGATKDINVSQGTTGNDQISFTYNPNGGDDFPPSAGTINYQIKRGGVQVYPSSGWATATGQKAQFNNNIGPLTMTEVAQNDTYTVYIKLVL